MIALSLEEIAEAVGGELVDGAPATIVSGSVETDSRLVGPGSVFFALPGEQTDGRRFAPAAVAAGAALVVARERLEVGGAAQIVVEDGYAALAALAHEVVRRIRAAAEGGDPMRVVGITGSNGKTSTKNMLRAILAGAGETVAPEGSFNNHVGAPISMLRATASTRYLIVEMGASAIGDVERLVRIAQPDVGVVLKVGLAHAGEFGGIEFTERAKSEMVVDLPASAVALLNVDDDRVWRMRERTRARVVGFGLGQAADYRIADVETSREGTSFTVFGPGNTGAVRVQLGILGEHHAMNATAALAVASEWGVPLADGAAALGGMRRAERWRMEVLDGGPEGVTVVNDAYNASPDSMAAALRTLAQIARPGERTVAVLGEMAELGEFSQEEHDKIGRLAVRLGIGQLVVVGDGAQAVHQAASLEGSWDGESVFVPDAASAEALLAETLRPGDVVLVKSSKSAGLRFLGDRLGGVSA